MTLNCLKSGGLASVDVPVIGDDGEVKGWTLITEPGDLHKVVAKRNRTHLNQASATPLGHSRGYQLFHREEHHDTARKVLNGELEWKHPMDKVNEFVNNLARVYDEEALAKESNLINAHITAEEFRHCLKNKKESTESSPSGRHIGHYKPMLGDDNLVNLIVAMINIGFSSGVVLERWEHKISVMLEKDKGSPKLHRLRIIQLFEADYNFLLALVFGHRLMRFAQKHCDFNESQYRSMNGKQAQSAILNKILMYD